MRKAQKAGESTALDRKVELYPDLIPIWNAFMELSSSRHVGMAGPSGIAVSDVAAWLDLAQINDPLSRGEWYRLIRTMDNTYLDHIRSKQGG